MYYSSLNLLLIKPDKSQQNFKMLRDMVFQTCNNMQICPYLYILYVHIPPINYLKKKQIHICICLLSSLFVLYIFM